MNAPLILKPKLNCLYTQWFYSLFNESFQFADNNFVFTLHIVYVRSVAKRALDLLTHSCCRHEKIIFVTDTKKDTRSVHTCIATCVTFLTRWTLLIYNSFLVPTTYKHKCFYSTQPLEKTFWTRFPLFIL